MGVSAVHRFFNSLPLRYGALFISALVLAISLYMLTTAGKGLGWLIASTLLVLLGIWDLLQKQHAILRNYPVMGHLRFIFEFIRPEIRQYFIEGDTEAQPFSRAQRSLVYQRAKGQVDNRPFGTQLDVSQQGYEWVNHSL
ncbi:MAG: FMN-binding glutamate synthase family protein, partial [Comamonas sp.]